MHKQKKLGLNCFVDIKRTGTFHSLFPIQFQHLFSFPVKFNDLLTIVL